MFGGFGLYCDGLFFGIIIRGRLYFKTDAVSREQYVDAGMEPFRPNPKQTLKTYYEVPPEIIDDSVTLTTWARTALVAAADNR
jgi:DNA transformation protein